MKKMSKNHLRKQEVIIQIGIWFQKNVNINQKCGSGVKVLLSEMCCGYEDIPKEISEKLMCPVLLCYIYDGDYWGYFFYENGKELNVFNPIPDYFEDISMEQRKHLAGNSEIISKYFNIENAKIKNYLQEWTEDILEAAEKRAYEGDECCIGEDWQMADFMKAIGYSYDWGN